MKKIAKTLLLALLAAALSSVFACGSGSGAEFEIAVESRNLPQTVYVKGADLNLHGGILTVTEGGVATEIPLTAKGVTVSGYNKNLLGDQDLTVTYREKTAVFTVTVVERLQIDNYVTTYRVGEELDLTKGRLQVTRDDGSAYIVLLSDEAVSVTGYDSSKTGVQNLTAAYTRNGDVYTVSFSVTVYAAA